MNFTYNSIKTCRVIDGDTVELTLDLGFKISIKERFRLAGINAPEGVHTEAKAWLEKACGDCTRLVATTYKPDKYGRWLVTLSDPSYLMSINERMVQLGLAVPYMVDKL